MSHYLFFADALPSWAGTLTVGAFVISILGNLAQWGMYKTMQKSLAQKQQVEFSPQPLIMEMKKEFPTKEEFLREQTINKDEHDKLFSKIGGVERGTATRLEEQLKTMRSENNNDRSLLHEKINQTRESVASLDMANQIQNQQMAALQTDVKTILSRLPRRAES